MQMYPDSYYIRLAELHFEKEQKDTQEAIERQKKEWNKTIYKLIKGGR